MARFIERNKLTTPKLRARYVTLGKAKKYNPEDQFGSYSVSLTLDPAEHQEWVTRMEEMAEDMYQEFLDKEGKKRVQRRDPVLPFKQEEDEDGELTGQILVKFSQKEKGYSKKTDRTWDNKVHVLDTLKKPIPDEQAACLTYGTEMYISFTARAYFVSGSFGISFKPKAVLITDPQWRDDDGTSAFDDMEVEPSFILGADEENDSDF